MSRHFAMLVSSSQARPAVAAAGPAGEEGSRLRAGLASRVLSGPGLWLEELEDLDRRGLIEELLADGVLDEAVATAPHGHQLDRALTAKNTVLCVLAGCLFPGDGYDGILRAAFGMPGLALKPGTPVPTGPALSKARVLSGEQVIRRAFELDAARGDVEPGIGATWHGMETTSFDGTTAELFNSDALAEAFGVPAGGTKPKVRIVAHVQNRVPPLGRRRHRRLPRRRERAGGRARFHAAGRNAQPGRPGILLHGPLDPVLLGRRAPVLAGQERGEVRAVQDAQDPARRL